MMFITNRCDIHHRSEVQNEATLNLMQLFCQSSNYILELFRICFTGSFMGILVSMDKQSRFTNCAAIRIPEHSLSKNRLFLPASSKDRSI